MAEIASFGVNVDQNTRLAQNAQNTADDANAKNSANSQQIANINDPNYLSPFEKPQLEIQMDNFATIYAADKDIATSESIDFTAYDASYQAYLAYMTPLIADMTTYSPIVRATFNSMVTAVQVEQKRLSTATQAQYNQQINQAKTDIANGQTKYQALQADAANMKSDAANVATTASQAIASAGFANDTANAAQSSAMAAVNQAGFASDASVQASQAASSALASALSAESAASSAVSQASSAAADSKDAKQIAGAVSQSYKTLTDGSTMTIAELEGGLAVKLTKKDLDGYATETWAQNQIEATADGINGTMSSIKDTVDGQTTSINDLQADSSGFKTQFTTINDNIGKNTTDIGTLQADSSGFKAQFTTVNDTIGKHTTDIGTLQATSKGLQSTVSDKVSSDQLTQLSDQLTNKISDLSSSTSSQFTQTSKDINGLVKKGDVVNQFNLDAGGILLDTSGSTAKIILSSNNIELDSANPVVMGSANITNLLTSKTIEASSITSTTKIIGSDIQAAMIHSADNSFSLNGATGDIIGASIQSSDGAWGITANGKISGASVASSLIDISGDGSGPNFDAENVTPDTATGIYSRYKYANPNVGFDVNGNGRKMYKNGYLVINGDTFLNRTIGDWSADGGGKYVYDTMYEANVIKMRAYNYTGSNVQTDDPSKTQGVISSRLDIQPSAITMGTNFSVGNPNILIDYTGRIKGGLIATNAAHSIGTTDGGDLHFMQMNKDATNVGGSSISIHVKKLYESSLLSLKTDIKPIDPHKALTEVVKNDVMGYHFKNDKTTDPKSVSVILDDINPVPKYYTSDIFKSADGTGRNDGTIVGYLMLSIKDLNSRLQKLEGAN